MIAGVALAQAAIFVFSGPRATLATSVSRTGRPLRYAMMTSLNCAASVIWSLALIVEAWSGPSKTTLGGC